MPGIARIYAGIFPSIIRRVHITMLHSRPSPSNPIYTHHACYAMHADLGAAAGKCSSSYLSSGPQNPSRHNNCSIHTLRPRRHRSKRHLAEIAEAELAGSITHHRAVGRARRSSRDGIGCCGACWVHSAGRVCSTICSTCRGCVAA